MTPTPELKPETLSHPFYCIGPKHCSARGCSQCELCEWRVEQAAAAYIAEFRKLFPGSRPSLPHARQIVTAVIASYRS